MNNADTSTLNEFVRTLNILHLALVMGAVIMFLVIYFYGVKEPYFNYTDTSDIFLFICPILALAGLFGGEIIARKHIMNIDPKLSLQEKLDEYRVAKIREFALIEGPILLSIVYAMQTENLFYFIIAGVLIIFMYAKRISAQKIKDELSLK